MVRRRKRRKRRRFARVRSVARRTFRRVRPRARKILTSKATGAAGGGILYALVERQIRAPIANIAPRIPLPLKMAGFSLAASMLLPGFFKNLGYSGISVEFNRATHAQLSGTLFGGATAPAGNGATTMAGTWM